MTTFESFLMGLNLALMAGNFWLAWRINGWRKETLRMLDEVKRLNESTARMMDRLS